MTRIYLDAKAERIARTPPAPVRWAGVKRVHILGICGSAMGALAQLLAAAGYEVRGSDQGAYPPMSTRLTAVGIPIFEGFAPKNLDWAPDIVVVGNVMRPDHDEAVAVRERGLPYCSLPQALGALFIGERRAVVVTGTHGKTTTSSMVAWLLDQGGLEPGFLIGGVTGNFQAGERMGAGDIVVVEGDEYDSAYFDKGPKFLHYRPLFGAINNIEYDHADIYADIAAVEAAFARFAVLVPAHGRLVVRHDDARARRVAALSPAPIWTFAVRLEDADPSDPSPHETKADLQASELVEDARGTAFTLHLPGHPPRPAFIPVWGVHNLENALTAAGLALAAGLIPDAITAGLATFSLPKKRQDLRGVANDIPVIDDFAHHPTAIAETLAATRRRYPGRQILALFEVESNTSRRRVFQAGFARALGQADAVWFCAAHTKNDGLAPEERLDLDALVASIQAAGTPATVIPDVPELARTVARAAHPGADVIVAMSGRDFHGIHAKILDALRAAEGR